MHVDYTPVSTRGEEGNTQAARSELIGQGTMSRSAQDRDETRLVKNLLGGGWKRGSKGPPPPEINFSGALAPPPPKKTHTPPEAYGPCC